MSSNTIPRKANKVSETYEKPMCGASGASLGPSQGVGFTTESRRGIGVGFLNVTMGLGVSVVWLEAVEG